jgi:N utilization substance protein B
MKPIEEDNFRVPKLYKDAKDFVKDLFRKQS